MLPAYHIGHSLTWSRRVEGQRRQCAGPHELRMVPAAWKGQMCQAWSLAPCSCATSLSGLAPDKQGLEGSSLLIRETRPNPLLEEKIPAHLSLSITENRKNSPGFEAHMLCIPNDSSLMPQRAPSTNKCGPSVPGAARPKQHHVFKH